MSRLLSRNIPLLLLAGLLIAIFAAVPEPAVAQQSAAPRQSSVVAQQGQSGQQVVAQQAGTPQAGGQQAEIEPAEGQQSESAGQLGDSPAAADGEAAPQIAGRKRMTATRTPRPPQLASTASRWRCRRTKLTSQCSHGFNRDVLLHVIHP